VELTCQKTRGALTFKGWRERAPSWSRRTAHGGLELAWAEEGALSYRIGRSEELTAPAGCMVMVPEGVEHRTWQSAGGSARSLHVSDAVTKRLCEQLGPRLFFAALQPSVVPVPMLTQRLGEALESGADDSLSKLAVLAVLEAAAGDSVRKKVHDWRLMRALEHLFAHWNESLEVDTLARVAGLSRFHFTRLFEARVGQSPYQFLLGLRLDAAARSLERGTSVTSAATASGFSDLSRFGQQFRRRFGQAPSAWAAAA
jgi:AraC-like DNA-binding protein